MTAIEVCALPEEALLARYTRAGAYTDCYKTRVPYPVSLEQYVEAFYTSRVFKLERLVLTWVVSKPSTDDEASELAAGRRKDYAAWTVEGRSTDQLLMCDYQQFTRSWLMVKPLSAGSSSSTALYFGSAVVPVIDENTGRPRFSASFKMLLGFHKIYSRILLRSARMRLGVHAR